MLHLFATHMGAASCRERELAQECRQGVKVGHSAPPMFQARMTEEGGDKGAGAAYLLHPGVKLPCA
jgi:hypothetical protein